MAITAVQLASIRRKLARGESLPMVDQEALFAEVEAQQTIASPSRERKLLRALRQTVGELQGALGRGSSELAAQTAIMRVQEALNEYHAA